MAQNQAIDKTKSFSSFDFDLSLWDGYQYKSLSEEFLNLGILSNPGSSEHPDVKESVCDGCPKDDILSVYYQFLLKPAAQNVEGGILVVRYKDVPTLKSHIPTLEVGDEDIYLIKDNDLIYIWNHEEDDPERMALLKSARSFYENKGATYFPARQKEALSLDELNQWIEGNDTAKQQEINGNSNRRTKHIFHSQDAFIVFYDDGTVRICPDCRLNQVAIAELGKESAYSIYLESATGVVIHSKMGELDEAVIIDYNTTDDIGRWAMKDFKELEPIPLQ